VQGAKKLILAGAIPDREFERRLRAVISATGQTGHVVLTGLLDERALLDEFARASALVLPSYQETAPMVIQQAMAARLPVIATRVGGIPDMIENEISGFLFAPGDITVLQQLLQRFAEGASLDHGVANAARIVAHERFTAENVASATLAAYQSILAGN
jgi:glycosyltransferase involved in cell wall biosynthesis